MDPNTHQSLDCLASPDMNIQRSSTGSTGLHYVSLAERTTRISAIDFEPALYLQYRPIVMARLSAFSSRLLGMASHSCSWLHTDAPFTVNRAGYGVLAHVLVSLME